VICRKDRVALYKELSHDSLGLTEENRNKSQNTMLEIDSEKITTP